MDRCSEAHDVQIFVTESRYYWGQRKPAEASCHACLPPSPTTLPSKALKTGFLERTAACNVLYWRRARDPKNFSSARRPPRQTDSARLCRRAFLNRINSLAFILHLPSSSSALLSTTSHAYDAHDICTVAPTVTASENSLPDSQITKGRSR